MVRPLDITDDVAAHHVRNKKLVENITGHGASLERERKIDCFFYAASEGDAIALSASLQSEGVIELSLSHADRESEHPWSVQGTVTSSVSYFTSEEQVARFVRLAAAQDALFDGWGTSLDECPPTI